MQLFEAEPASPGSSLHMLAGGETERGESFLGGDTDILFWASQVAARMSTGHARQVDGHSIHVS
jgi:hypothetical protein